MIPVALHDKQTVALTSVLAAVALTLGKLAVGIATGSLGILAEAAHSGLDLVAALMTFLAVRIAARDPDETHHYGHERFENVSALFETALLFATCGWIVYEAGRRLMSGGGHEVDATWPAFAVMAGSIVVDFWRSRALSQAAEEHGSPALEADALHFSTDLWSSAVVILGLAAVWASDNLPGAAGLEHADALAALGVAAIVVFVSLRLLRATVDALVDRAPPGVAEEVRRAASEVAGVLEVRRVRLRRAGNKLFADVVVAAPRTTGFTAAHRLTDDVEAAVLASVPNADVLVHVEPTATESESTADRVHYVARQRGVRVHDVRVRQVDDRLEVDMHVEVDPHLKLADAHALADGLEQELLETDARLTAVNTHLEAPAPEEARADDVTDLSAGLIDRVRAVSDRLVGPGATHEVRVYESGDLRNLVVHATFKPDLDVEQVHTLSAEVERALRAELEGVGTVLIHAEPRV